MTELHLATDVAALKAWREEQVDPKLRKLDEMATAWAQMQGSLGVIKWMVGICVALLTGIIVAWFAWGLGHVSVSVQNLPGSLGAPPAIESSVHTH